MSDSLAFLIDAPMQSWGASSKFQRRETESWPTKSAMLGVIAAALGIDKYEADEPELLAPYAQLVFSVFRLPKDHLSLRLSDYHTIGGGYDKKNPAEVMHIPKRASGASIDNAVLTRRTYLTDARFIAVFQGEFAIIEKISAALLNPKWGVWFGRKTCIPAMPLSPVIAASARAALAELLQRLGKDPVEAESLEGLTETDGPGTYYQMDQPVAFGRHHGPVPEVYRSRPVRRVLASDLES